MSDIKGRSLQIGGKTVINSNYDILGNNLDVNSIRIRSGKLNVNDDARFEKDVLVLGTLTGNIVSNTSHKIFQYGYDKLVSLLLRVENSDIYAIFSGFFIQCDGWVLTSMLNFPIDKTYQIWATIVEDDSSLKIYKADGVFFDKTKQIALLKFPDIQHHKHFCCYDEDKLHVGESCYILEASNQTNDSSVYTGTISGLKYYDNNLNQRFLTCNAVLSNVNISGQPVLGQNGNLIGMIFSNLLEDDSMSSMSSISQEQVSKSNTYLIIPCNEFLLSTTVMIDTLNDYHYNIISNIGIEKMSNVTALHIITSGLWGKLEPKGVIIEKLRPLSILKERGVCDNDIILKIDNETIGFMECHKIVCVLQSKDPGSIVEMTIITPPYFIPRTIYVRIPEIPLKTHSSITQKTLSKERNVGLDVSKRYVKPVYVEKKAIYNEFENENHKTQHEIYQVTHEDEIKHEKKMILLDRLKRVKERKKSKTRVKSRKNR